MAGGWPSGWGLEYWSEISNLWPQVGRQIKWKIVCFDFYLVGHVLRGRLSRQSEGQGGGNPFGIVDWLPAAAAAAAVGRLISGATSSCNLPPHCSQSYSRKVFS